MPNYAVYTPEVDASSLIPVRVLRGVEKEVAPTADAPQPQLIKKGQEKNMVCETELSENLEAPVLKGQVIGRIVMKLDGEEVASYAIPGGGGRGEDDLRPGFFHPAVGATGVIF